MKWKNKDDDWMKEIQNFREKYDDGTKEIQIYIEEIWSSNETNAKW